MYEEWVCSRCGMKVWRTALRSETGKATIPFPHSLELRPSDYSEPALCEGLISRTGNASAVHVDLVTPPEKYQEAVIAEKTAAFKSKKIRQYYHRKPELARAEAVKE